MIKKIKQKIKIIKKLIIYKTNENKWAKAQILLRPI
jgi:hypothetical protein